MNIGNIKASLKLADADLPVYFDFCECVPTNTNSWRGNYAEPAIGCSPSGYSGNGKPPTVAQFLDELEMATSGRLYSGWHGDTFSYTDNNRLHVDNYGDFTSTKIITGVEICEDRIVLLQTQNGNHAATPEGLIETDRIIGFSSGEINCPCGERITIYFNGGELDCRECKCGLIYRTEYTQIDLVVYSRK